MTHELRKVRIVRMPDNGAALRYSVRDSALDDQTATGFSYREAYAYQQAALAGGAVVTWGGSEDAANG
jgi:hypothetical protein